MYECAVCGKSYEHIEDRIECETKCVAERKKIEEEKKRNEHEAKRKEMASEIYADLDSLNVKLAKYFKAYDTLTLNKSYPYLKYLFNYGTLWL